MSNRIPTKSKELLQKSIESCLLAVEIYNKPQTKFKSGGYIVLMTIAWTSLFHAIFEKSKTEYYHKDKESGEYIIIDGEYKAWELADCLKEYFKTYDRDELPIRKNIEFFIPLRNKIEHRFMPEIDEEVFGECQALLHNFEYILIKEFGSKYAIRENLVFSLQFARTYPSSKEKENTAKQNKGFEKVKKYIMDFRNSLEDETFSDQKYRFSVYLLPKLINNKNKAEYAIEWIDYDPKDPEEMKKYEQVLGVVKEKIRPISNYGGLKASEVCDFVVAELKKVYGETFKLSYSTHHPICYTYYGVRPKKGDPNPEKTDSNFCTYDPVHDDYVYTKEWAKFLIKKLSGRSGFLKFFPTGKHLIQGTDNEEARNDTQQLESNEIETHF